MTWPRGLAWLLAGLLAVPLATPAEAALPAPGPPLADAMPAGWPRPDVEDVEDVAAHLLVDASNGQVLAEDDASVRRPVASTVKILTALTAVTRTTMDEQVTVGREVLAVPGAGVGLAPGDTWSVHELLTAMLARSGNDAAEALAVHVAGDAEAFLALMVADAEALGVSGLELYSVSGLDDRNRLSADDLAVFARAALAHDELATILAAPVVELPARGRVPNRNELLAAYPGATGVKTGFTDAAGNSLVASARRDGRELVAVVLDAGEDPQRFEVAAGLLDHGFEEYDEHALTGTLRLSVAGGRLRYELDELVVSTPVGDPPRLDWSVPARPPERVGVAVTSGGTSLAELDVAPRTTASPTTAPEPVDGAAAIGRAVADGIYAALRAAVADGASGSLVTSSQGDGS